METIERRIQVLETRIHKLRKQLKLERLRLAEARLLKHMEAARSKSLRLESRRKEFKALRDGGKSYVQIGKELGVTAQTARNHVKRVERSEKAAEHERLDDPLSWQASMRTRNLFWAHDITTIDAFKKLTIYELKRWRNCGALTIHEINQLSESHGFGPLPR
jgi:predicted transcriptional regulator